MAAVAADDVRDLGAVGARAREPLIVVRVAGKIGVRPEADLFADLVDLRLHVDAPAVLRERVRRMVMGEQQSTGILRLLQAHQRGAQVAELGRSNVRIRDHARILERVAVQHQNRDKRSFEREEDAGLDLRGSREHSGLRHHHVAGCRIRAKVSQETFERRRGRHLRCDHAIVVACSRENRCRVVAVRIVKLIVVVLNFAEAVHDVAEQKVKLGNLHLVRFFEIREHLIDDEVLRSRAGCAAAIAERMEYDLFVGLDRGDRGVATEYRLQHEQRFETPARCRKRQRVDAVSLVERVDLVVQRLVRRMLDHESFRIGCRRRIRKGGRGLLRSGAIKRGRRRTGRPRP